MASGTDLENWYCFWLWCPHVRALILARSEAVWSVTGSLATNFLHVSSKAVSLLVQLHLPARGNAILYDFHRSPSSSELKLFFFPLDRSRLWDRPLDRNKAKSRFVFHSPMRAISLFFSLWEGPPLLKIMIHVTLLRTQRAVTAIKPLVKNRETSRAFLVLLLFDITEKMGLPIHLVYESKEKYEYILQKY